AVLVLQEAVALAVEVAVDLDARRGVAARVVDPAVGLAVGVRVLGARGEAAVGQVGVRRVELAVEVGVLFARQDLSALRVDRDLDLGLAVAVGVERLHDALLLVDLDRLRVEDLVRDVALAGALRGGGRVGRRLGGGAVLGLLLQRLVRLFLLVDRREQLFLVLQLGLDLGLEVLLLLELVVDLVFHLLVGALGRAVVAAPAVARRWRLAAPALERNVARDQTPERERARAGGGADRPELGADYGADDHALERCLGAPRDLVLAAALR